jgi:hypothetical protein
MAVGTMASHTAHRALAPAAKAALRARLKADHFTKQLSFARRVVSSFNVSAAASHVAQIQYDTAATID